MTRLATLVLAVLALPGVATAGEVIVGPIHAEVVSAYDGDTLTVDAHPWPGVTIRTGVRVNGIDTPEIRGKCDAEKEMAREARDLAREIVGARITVTAQGRIGGRMPIVLPLSAIGRSHLGDPGLRVISGMPDE